MKELNRRDYEKFINDANDFVIKAEQILAHDVPILREASKLSFEDWMKFEKGEALSPTVVVTRKTGFINIHIDIKNEHVMVSTKPYPSREEAEKGRLVGFGIEKIGCFEIEYTAYPISRMVGSTIECDGDTF